MIDLPEGWEAVMPTKPRYYYVGFLSSQVAGWIADMVKEYSHVLELHKMPTDWSEWSKANLKEWDIPDHETGIGRKALRYGVVNNGEGSVFLFLSSAEDWDKVVAKYCRGHQPAIVKNLYPLSTLI